MREGENTFLLLKNILMELRDIKKLLQEKESIQRIDEKSPKDAEKEFNRWVSDFNKRFM